MIKRSNYIFTLFVLCLIFTACSSQTTPDFEVIAQEPAQPKFQKPIEKPTVVGAERISLYIELLNNKRVGIVSNQTSTIGENHLVDTLLSLGINIRRVFSPEHGFRGNHDAGANIDHSVDQKTGLPIFSLHGKTKKPTKESLKDIDIIVFDIQDVGVRFYTYISTLHYVMEAVAEENIEIVVLDRPNPNAHYIDGPVLDTNFRSFIGMHPVPVVYGMTIGEYAKMINGEYWLKDSLQANLKIIPLQNWTHNTPYTLPIAPSPNLPNQLSIYLYPSLCFFEGTEVSVGRGTAFPFQVWGHPNAQCDTSDHFSFTPVSIPGKSKYPKHENKLCIGEDFRNHEIDTIRNQKKLSISMLQKAIQCVQPEKKFFNRIDFFNLLAGNDIFADQLQNKLPEEEIRASWKESLEVFKQKRKKYLIYK